MKSIKLYEKKHFVHPEPLEALEALVWYVAISMCGKCENWVNRLFLAVNYVHCPLSNQNHYLPLGVVNALSIALEKIPHSHYTPIEDIMVPLDPNSHEQLRLSSCIHIYKKHINVVNLTIPSVKYFNIAKLFDHFSVITTSISALSNIKWSTMKPFSQH